MLNENWRFREGAKERIECEEGLICFADANVIESIPFTSGVGSGVCTHYEGFSVNGEMVPYAFDTIVWKETVSEDVYFEWIPICEEGLHVKKIYWPGEMEFEEKSADWYSLLNEEQGLMIPNNWEVELGKSMFGGRFCTASSYMPWFGQVKDRKGYIAICLTPWNAGYKAEHPAGGPYTHVGPYLEPSLGKMEYRRVFRYTFLDDCDYNDLCKVYRAFVKERGHFKSLEEKAAKNPSVNKLIGCAVVHSGIKTCIQPDSRLYNQEHPEENQRLVPFAKREQDMRALHEMGVKKLYLHLDGWAQPGYDNQHPDYYPACEEAGGWEGMKALSDTMQELGYLFGIHDQYRDYYHKAETYDPYYACVLPDGSYPQHNAWAGGMQNYLCATQAPYYVKRNFSRLEEHGIHLDAAYLDVFTCNEGDECANPHHRMTRRDCYEYRGQCFEYLLSKNILSSSEEVSDWSMQNLIFCHYAPYDFMLKKPGTPKEGIPVPLFNLVYHDCLIIPWMMDDIKGQEDYMLYALLNGGIPYLVRDGAYANIDGSFGDAVVAKLMQENIARCNVVSELHEKVAKCEMLWHKLVDGNPYVHRTKFADGTVVTVDLENHSYEITQE